MIRRHHPLPFGAELQRDGRVRFRLWAPAARHVEVRLSGRAQPIQLPLAAEDEGWFGAVTDLAGAGTYYQFQIDGDLLVPDPASRFQPEDVHGPSQIIDPTDFAWQDEHWRGRPWEEAVIYELHVGSFTPDGTFAAVKNRLDHLVELGVTAVELMPVADFPGARNWGYDGVALFAPENRYGTPDDLKDLVQTAHAKGLMVLLDVVYNHFGPEGNYLHAYANRFFTEHHHTPWGAAINYDDVGSAWVRQFVIHNALYWLEEYHFDGLRLDAVHAILDDSDPHILEALADAVRRGPGDRRHVHLVLENDQNQARYLRRDEAGRPLAYVAQWNDDIHHVLHVLTTGERSGYYADYAEDTVHQLGRCLTEGFAYQGEPSAYREGERRGEPSAHLPPTAFVAFLQNHDQVGNRAFGERITALADAERVRAATALLLLAPSPPLLFMGQEWGSQRSFPFFCDFGPDLAGKVTEGRRQEFARFPEFADPAERARIPDPVDPATFAQAVLDWTEPAQPAPAAWLALHRNLLQLRHRELVPRLKGICPGMASYRVLGGHGLRVQWTLADGAQWTLLANLGDSALNAIARPAGRCIFATDPALEGADSLPPRSVGWFLAEGPARVADLT